MNRSKILMYTKWNNYFSMYGIHSAFKPNQKGWKIKLHKWLFL